MTRKLSYINDEIEQKNLLRNLKSKIFSEKAIKSSRSAQQTNEYSSLAHIENKSNSFNMRPDKQRRQSFAELNQTLTKSAPSSNLEANQKLARKIVTSFDELCELKARCRTPIDIQHTSSQSQPFSCPPNNKCKANRNSFSSFTREVNFGSIGHIGNFLSGGETSSNDNDSTINFSKLITNANRHKHDVTSTRNSTLLHDESETNISHADNHNNNNNTLNRKYFSFLTTNKLFSSSLSINEPKLRIHKNQLVDENDLKQKSHLESSIAKEKTLQTVTHVMSTSSSASNSDSGCGCSIARSSILSNSDLLNQNEMSGDTLTVPILSNFEFTSSSCSPSNSDKLESLSNFESVNLSANKTSDNTLKKDSEFNVKTISKPSDDRKKVLTILFDYASNGFQVRKMDNVKVIRDYDENLYLVACMSNGNIGFVPKEYTVDLTELKERINQNFLIQQKTQSTLLSSSFKNCLSNEQNFTNCVNLKLTQL